MLERISTLEIRRRLGELLDRVTYRHDEFIVERKGRPVGAIVPVEKLEHLERLARLRLHEGLRSKTALPQGNADSLADEAKHKTRRKK